MSRIEIPIEEFNGLKNKIKHLESILVEKSKEISIYKEKLDIIEKLVTELENEKLIDRLFFWKNILKPFKDAFKKNSETK